MVDTNTSLIAPFIIGDRVNITHPDNEVAVGTVIRQHRGNNDFFDEGRGPWMVTVRLDDGRIFGCRPQYITLEQ